MFACDLYRAQETMIYLGQDENNDSGFIMYILQWEQSLLLAWWNDIMIDYQHVVCDLYEAQGNMIYLGQDENN